MQPKPVGNLRMETRIAPPVYRPQSDSDSRVQLKSTGNFRLETRPAPPVYTPLKAAVAMQPKTGTASIQVETPPARAVYNPNLPRAAAPARRVAPGSQAGAAGINRREAYSSQVKSSSIQRTILRQTGVVKNKHLAEQFVNNNNSLGYTPPHVNNLIVGLDTTREQVAAAVKAPTIAVTQVREGEYEAVVTEVPTNYVGYMMYLPMPGPWEAAATDVSRTLGFLGIREDRLPDGVQIDHLEVKVTGHDGKDDTLINQVTKHENVHAEDILRLSDEYFVPWDRRLTEAKDRAIRFTGATAEEAKRKVYEAARGTPEQIGAQFFEATERASHDFHATQRGKTVPLEPLLTRLRGVNNYQALSRWRLTV